MEWKRADGLNDLKTKYPTKDLLVDHLKDDVRTEHSPHN